MDNKIIFTFGEDDNTIDVSINLTDEEIKEIEKLLDELEQEEINHV